MSLQAADNRVAMNATQINQGAVQIHAGECPCPLCGSPAVLIESKAERGADISMSMRYAHIKPESENTAFDRVSQSLSSQFKPQSVKNRQKTG